MKETLWERLTERITSPIVQRKVHEQLSQIDVVGEPSHGYFPIVGGDRERSAAERYDKPVCGWRRIPN
jgi:hypothetical protein